MYAVGEMMTFSTHTHTYMHTYTWRHVCKSHIDSQHTSTSLFDICTPHACLLDEVLFLSKHTKKVLGADTVGRHKLHSMVSTLMYIIKQCTNQTTIDVVNRFAFSILKSTLPHTSRRHGEMGAFMHLQIDSEHGSSSLLAPYACLIDEVIFLSKLIKEVLGAHMAGPMYKEKSRAYRRFKSINAYAGNLDTSKVKELFS